MALGATHHNWTPPVEGVVQDALNRFSILSANTYRRHPWPGWDGLSVDFWDKPGRGHPITEDLGWTLTRYLMRLPGQPHIRHLIHEHSLWTSWGGWSFWAPRDHTGPLRHVHVTYWP